jgi:hypothetical protein
MNWLVSLHIILLIILTKLGVSVTILIDRVIPIYTIFYISILELALSPDI